MDIMIGAMAPSSPLQPILKKQGEKNCQFDDISLPISVEPNGHFLTVHFIEMILNIEIFGFACLDFPHYNSQNSSYSCKQTVFSAKQPSKTNFLDHSI